MLTKLEFAALRDAAVAVGSALQGGASESAAGKAAAMNDDDGEGGDDDGGDLTNILAAIKLIAECKELTAKEAADANFMQALHSVLLELHVLEGSLVCPESGRVFPISDGIPNMLLNEDEV